MDLGVVAFDAENPMIAPHPVFDAFVYHDQEGLPIAFAMEAAAKLGHRVNLAAFACDAMAAGWTDEKLRQTLESACCDFGMPFNWDEFRGKLAQLWTLVGAQDEPECWRAMKLFIQNKCPLPS